MNKCDDKHKKEITETPRFRVGVVLDAVYGTYVSVRPAKNLTQLAIGSTLHLWWQTESICLVSSTNH